MSDLFVGRAKVETMRRDINRLRKAIRGWDPEAAEKAWDKCERWVSCLSPTEGIDHLARNSVQKHEDMIQ